MRTEDLRLFQAIAQTRSLRKAADQMRITQPSATRALRHLEAGLGAQLVCRGPGGSVLTDIGMAALPYVEAMLRAQSRLAEEIQARLNLGKGRLRLGVPGAVTTALLARVLRRLSAEHPGLDLQITEAGSIRISSLVASGDLEIGIVRRAEVLGPLEGPVVVEDLRRTRLVVCVPHRHEWAQTRSAVALPELAGQPLILPHGGYLANEIVRRCLGEGGARVVCRTEHPATARALVAQEFGITVATEEEASRDPHRGLFDCVRIGEPEGMVWTSIVRQDSFRTAAVAKRFLQVCSENGDGDN